MDTPTSLTGPVESIDGQLVLRIPLAAGGAALAAAAQGISRVGDGDLVITIPGWLAEKLSIHEGSFVTVDNRGGKFNIILTPTPAP